MASRGAASFESTVNIDPNSRLLIKVEYEDPITKPQVKSERSRYENRSYSPLGYTHSDFARHLNLCDLSLESQPTSWNDVCAMSTDSLLIFQQRVLQMEEANMTLLTKIYGEFTFDRKPFPLISQMDRSSYPEHGSSQHRELLYAQYVNMRSIANRPSSCVDYMKPPAEAGALLLQVYHMQMLTFGQKSRKGRSSVTGTERKAGQASPSPKLSAGRLQHIPRPVFLPNETVISTVDGNSKFPSYSALSDYEMQLRMLEAQNKKRLMMARSLEVPCVNDARANNMKKLQDAEDVKCGMGLQRARHMDCLQQQPINSLPRGVKRCSICFKTPRRST